MKKLFSFLVVFILVACSKDPVIYTLTATANPAEGGSVSPSSQQYDSGDVATVTATASAEYVFQSWSGSASGSSPSTTVTMDSDKAVVANFVKKKYALTVKTEGEGSVTEKVIKAGVATDYNSGTVVELTAVPEGEWLFVEWTGDLTGSENPKEITIDKAKTVTAVFVKKQYPLTIEIEGEGTVSEKVIKQGLATDYNSGTIVELTAEPTGDWEFVEWSGDITSTENPVQITIDGPKTVKVKFSRYFGEYYNKPSYELETPKNIWVNYYDLLMEENGYDMGKYAVGYPEAYADFDFDGYIDILFAPSLYENQGGYGDIELWFFKNTGDDVNFVQKELNIEPHLGTFNATQAVVGDFNNDGKPDVVYSECGRDIHLGPGTTSTVLMSGPDGYSMKNISETSVSYGGGASGDIDNDGDLDVILGGLDALTVYLNDGNGVFEEKIQYADEALNLNPVNDMIELVEIDNPSGGSMINLQLIDIDKDGFLDMIGGYDKFRRINTIYYGNGINFSKDRIDVLPYTLEWDSLHNINFYDIDGDGNLEVIAGRSRGNGFEGFYLEAYKKIGNEYKIMEGVFDNSSANEIRWIMQISISDIDNNGKIDIYSRDKGHLGFGKYRWEWNGSSFEKRF